MLDPRELIGDASDADWFGAKDKSTHHHREGYKRPTPTAKGGIRATLLDLPICGLDGEGQDFVPRKQDYYLLVAVWPAGRRCIEKERQLSTSECFDFLLDLPDDHVYLVYGGSYDMNMWLRDLPKAYIDRLLQTGKLRWRQYHIKWIERKYMTIKAHGRSRTVYDVLSFFQVPFLSPDPGIVNGACDAWLPERSEDFAFVRLMKSLRGRFADVPEEDIRRYTYLECELLCELMRKFIDALKACEVRPRALYGPGAVAAAYLEKMGVRKHMAPLPEPIDEHARRAYFGGRFDAAVLGWMEECFEHDIKSAYPSVARDLPCLVHAAWEHLTGSLAYRQITDHGVYRVEWRVPDATRWGPFPHRTTKGLIFYPYEGAGWYHADEVKAAIEMYGDDAIKVTEGWALISNCDHRPFAFIDSLYALRKHVESVGNRAQGIVIKLILNSLYGKLAQQVGERKDRPPPFQCFFWAGEITARTRAKILRTIAMDPEKVISIATDGIVATEQLDIEYGEELGDWELDALASFAQISNGVYHATTKSGKTIDRARGLGRGVLDFSKGASMYRQWKSSHGLGTYAYRGRTRFITLREAHHRSDREQVKCQWLDDEWRTLKFVPQRRFPWPTVAGRKRDLLHTRLVSYVDYEHLHAGAPERESQLFKIKTTRETIDARDEHHGTSWYDSA
jgi:hypothetical protein